MCSDEIFAKLLYLRESGVPFGELGLSIPSRRNQCEHRKGYGGLYIEAKKNDVAILDDVVPAL